MVNGESVWISPPNMDKPQATGDFGRGRRPPFFPSWGVWGGRQPPQLAAGAAAPPSLPLLPNFYRLVWGGQEPPPSNAHSSETRGQSGQGGQGEWV